MNMSTVRLHEAWHIMLQIIANFQYVETIDA